MTPVSSRVSNYLLTAAEPRSNRKAGTRFGGIARKPNDYTDVQRKKVMNVTAASKKREMSKRGKKPSAYRRETIA
jgi:hypothetical protein